MTKSKGARFVKTQCKKASEKSRKSTDLGRQAVMHAMNAGCEMSRMKMYLRLSGDAWANYCRKRFSIGKNTAASYMLISKFFSRPDDIPDEICSIRSAVKVARAAKTWGTMGGQLPPAEWRSMEKTMFNRICYCWEQDPLDLKEEIGDGWEVHSVEATCGRAKDGHAAVPGACDILLKRSGTLEWLIVELKSQLRTGMRELEQLIEYMRSFRRRQRGKLLGVLVCENPTRGLRTAAAKAGVIVRTCKLTFQK